MENNPKIYINANYLRIMNLIISIICLLGFFAIAIPSLFSIQNIPELKIEEILALFSPLLTVVLFSSFYKHIKLTNRAIEFHFLFRTFSFQIDEVVKIYHLTSLGPKGDSFLLKAKNGKKVSFSITSKKCLMKFYSFIKSTDIDFSSNLTST